MVKQLIQENISLQKYNTLAVDASTRWFATIVSIEQLQEALAFVKAQNCPLLILGGGSNVVLGKDFLGLTILIKTCGMTIEKETHAQVFLSVAAGESWHNTVMYCVDQGWYGLENLALIPGSVGAAPIQNIGAYGVELTQCFSYLEALDIHTGKSIRFDHAACQFAYRDSVFKQSLKDKMIITRVVFVVSKTPVWSLNYPALQLALKDYPLSTLTSQQVAQAVMTIRQSKLPDPQDIPNVGSFFKNPIVDDICHRRLRQKHPQLVAYQQNDGGYKLAAGWLLEQAGWKGKWINEIAMHHQQALVLTNPSRRSGKELLDFTDQVITDVYQKYGIHLEVEPRIYA